MRNDANDELDNLPSLTPERREDFAEPREEPAPRSSRVTSSRAPVARTSCLSMMVSFPCWQSRRERRAGRY